jgi:hypothetical protein
MRSLLAVTLALCLLCLFSVPVQAQPAAQEKLDRLEGRIQQVDKDAGVMTILVGRNAVPRKVAFTAETKYTTRNEAKGSAADLKDGVRVICLGKFNDKNQLVATRIDFR